MNVLLFGATGMALSGVRLSRSLTISIPTIAPSPRTSPMQENCSAHWRKRALTRSPVRWARAGIFSASIASRTASAAAQASGVPPKVEPCVPGVKSSACFSAAQIAPIG